MTVAVGDVGRVDVELVREAPAVRYGVRDARPGPTPLHERERHDAPAGELVATIAATLGIDLADTQPRRLAREAAERARRELEAIVRYRDSGQPGDAEHHSPVATANSCGGGLSSYTRSTNAPSPSPTSDGEYG